MPILIHNMYSPYQVGLQGLTPNTYNKVDLDILREKIAVYQKLWGKFHSTYHRDRLQGHKDNFEFVCRQINQQMLESAQWKEITNLSQH